MGVGGTITETRPRMIWSPSLGASFAVFHLHAFLNERARKEKETEQEEKKGATLEGRRDENEVGTSIIFGGVVIRNLPFFLCVYYISTGPQVGVFLILKLFPRSSCISETMRERNLASWNTMIFGYARNCKAEEASLGFKEMKKDGLVLDGMTLLAFLTALSNLRGVKQGKESHAYAVRNGENFATDLW
ncbi:hypothetical protein NL676_017591 [Syzygium grande]|nr:hypothetical protein NL676_017591 [Syzygium grande]